MTIVIAEEDDVNTLIESAVQLADRSEQTVAIYVNKDNELDYEIVGAIDEFIEILEIIHPSREHKWH